VNRRTQGARTTTASPAGGTAETGGLMGRIRRQDGLIREALVVFLVFAIIALIMLDVLAVVSTRRALKQDPGAAARAAADGFALSGSEYAASQEAEKYVANHGARMTAFKMTPNVDTGTTFSVTATKEAPTRVFKYLGYLPWIGNWVKRQLNPQVTNDNSGGY
jgi:hypothetical protein